MLRTFDGITLIFIYFEGTDVLKTEKDFTIPLSPRSKEVIASQIGKNPTWVFTYAGKQNKSPNGDSWKSALKRAGIENFRWHDLRHTWATWHIQNGTPLHVLQELGGRSSIQMVQKYAHFSVDHLSEYVANFDTKLTQAKMLDEKKPVLKAV